MDLFADTPKALTPSEGAITLADSLRVVSITLATYDYLATVPAAFRVYANRSQGRRSLGCILFFLIRYSSMIYMATSNIGYLYHHFSSDICAHYFPMVPVFKVIQIMVSQAILGIRAYYISRRKASIGLTLLFIYIVVIGIQWFTNLYDRIPVMISGNCTTALAHPHSAFSSWTFYLAAILYDFLALFVSTFYLLRMKPSGIRESAATKLCKIFIFDSLRYFVALTVMNMMNLLLFRIGSLATGTSGASLGASMTWIMSQQIILHPFEAHSERLSAVVSLLPMGSSMPHENEVDGNPTPDDAPPTEF